MELAGKYERSTRRVMTFWIVVISFCLVHISRSDAAQQDNPPRAIPAMPGVEGAAKYTPGGRGGDVYHVTNMNPSGEGSLAYGIESSEGPRTIVFDIGGTIFFNETLFIKEKRNLTIAGQTAPGGGVTLVFQNDGMRIDDSEDIIVTHLRLVNKSVDNRFDVLHIRRSKNVLISHLSIRWGTRGNALFRPTGPVTTQYLINAEPTDRQLGGWWGRMRQEQGLFNYTIRKNLGIHQSGRFNMFQGGRFEFINNVTFNADLRWHNTFYIFSRPEYGARESNLGAQLADVNAIGNVLIDGHNPPETSFAFGKASRVFLEGNVRDRNPDAPFSPENADEDIYKGIPEYMVGHPNMIELPADEFARVDLPLDLRLTDAQRTRPLSARRAYIDVLSRSGASITRDEHDHRYIRDVMNKSTPPLPRTVADVPGNPFPDVDPGQRVQSTAKDGIADDWKIQRGLDPEKAYHQKYTNEGYTYLEKYLHWLMRKSIPPEDTETKFMVIPSTFGQGAFATVTATGRQSSPAQLPGQQANAEPAGRNSFTVGQLDDNRQLGLLRFDISKIEPGMINDAILELGIKENSDAGKIRVFGLNHDHIQQLWAEGNITSDQAPAIEVVSNRLELLREDLVLLGDLEMTGRKARLTNPNLAVYLNLAMYYREESESDLVTLVFKPLESGKTEFISRVTAYDKDKPQLKLEALPRE